jgi:hypothetical protein
MTTIHDPTTDPDYGEKYAPHPVLRLAYRIPGYVPVRGIGRCALMKQMTNTKDREYFASALAMARHKGWIESAEEDDRIYLARDLDLNEMRRTRGWF